MRYQRAFLVAVPRSRRDLGTAVFVPEGPPIVAWHEVPGKAPPEKDRPVGYGLIRAGVRTSRMSCARSYRTLRNGSFEGRFPRHFVPGYDRIVPPGRTSIFG
jgi:hypothetical protein